MSFFGNQDINRLALHTALHQAAMGLSLAFFAAFLLHAGLAPSGVFLTLAAILTLRFFVRAAVLPSVRLIGFRNTFLLGALLFAVEYLVLAAYDGSNARLLWFIVSDAVCSALHLPSQPGGRLPGAIWRTFKRVGCFAAMSSIIAPV